MKRAFEETGNDRQTIARTSVVAELAFAAPEAYKAIGEWKEKSEKLTDYVVKCREAVTPEIAAKIEEMKGNGELLPIT